MATTESNDLVKIREEQYDRFRSRLGARVSNYTDFMRVRNRQGGPVLQISDFFGVTAYAAQVDEPTPVALDSNVSTATVAPFEKLVTISEFQRDNNPEVISETVDMMADAGAATISDMAYDLVKALDTTAHPGAGAPYGAGEFYADTYTAPVVQSNLLTGALSATTLATAIQRLHEYKNKAGLPAGIDTGPGALQLVVPPSLMQTGKDLTKRPSEVYDGSGLQPGAGYDSIGLTVMPEATDDNDWFLFSKILRPVGIWIRKPPTIRISLAEKTGHIHIYASLVAVGTLEPWEGGFVMSKVA